MMQRFLRQYQVEPQCGFISSVWTNIKLLEPASVSLQYLLLLVCLCFYNQPQQSQLRAPCLYVDNPFVMFLLRISPPKEHQALHSFLSASFEITCLFGVFPFQFLALFSDQSQIHLRVRSNADLCQLKTTNQKQKSNKKTQKPNHRQNPKANTSIWFSAQQVNWHWSLKASIILWVCKHATQYMNWLLLTKEKSG